MVTLFLEVMYVTSFFLAINNHSENLIFHNMKMFRNTNNGFEEIEQID
ncbi:hypothetical protein CHCC5027_1730 [Bacillus paralicheniformis]|nr:hypothetical protein CHCC5027_1730 [Bacillus paralicheniformis]